MAIGLGGITGFLALKVWQLGRRATVRVQSLTLKAGGAFSRSGHVFAAIAVAWIVFTAHSAFVQWHRAWGRHWLNRTEVSRIDGLTGSFDPAATSATHRSAARRAARHFELADRFGLVEVSEIHLGIAWTALLSGDVASATERIRAVVALDPDSAVRHDNLVDLLVARGGAKEAIVALEAKLARVPPTPIDHFRMGQLLVHVGRRDDAAQHFAVSVAMAPENAAARYNLGALLRRLGRPKEAVAHLREAIRLDPSDAATKEELASALVEAGLGQE
jgi:predicted Zn-dependent protease